MRLPWGFRRRRVRTRVVRTRLGVTRCSEKRRRRLSPSRRIARAVRAGARVRKAPSRGSSPSPVHGRRDPRRRLWRGGSARRRARSGDGFGQSGDEDAGADPKPLAAGSVAVATRSRTKRKSASGARSQQQRPNPAASLCAQGRDRGRPHDGVAAAAIVVQLAHGASAGGGAGDARGSADEVMRCPRVGESCRGGAKCRWRAPQCVRPGETGPEVLSSHLSPTAPPGRRTFPGRACTVAAAVPTPDPPVAAGPTLTVSAPAPPASARPLRTRNPRRSLRSRHPRGSAVVLRSPCACTRSAGARSW
jgi:hypothetical protein